ncbi:hypothetical protein NSERUTF1_7020 [Nocardia seriolae]|nr:hypothetical protein NSERUTF1_7020 [Nocardia seriolae]
MGHRVETGVGHRSEAETTRGQRGRGEQSKRFQHCDHP